MQTNQTMLAETLNQSKRDIVPDSPWSFIIFIFPGVFFLPFIMERYQYLFNLAKNVQDRHLMMYSLTAWGIYIIMCIDISIWVYTIDQPQLMNMHDSELYLTVLYIIFFLSWYLSAKIEKYEQYLNQTNAKKIQNMFWTFSFLTNLFQYFLFYKRESQFWYLFLIKLSINFILAARILKMNQKSFTEPQIIHYLDINQIPSINIDFSKNLIKYRNADDPSTSFQIIIYIEKETSYKIERNVSDFLELSNQIKSEYTYKRFPLVSTKLPILDIDLLNEYLFWEVEDQKIILLLSDYLKKLVKDSSFMCNFLLDFLYIPKRYYPAFERFQSELEEKEEQYIESSNFGKITINFEDMTFHKLDLEAVENLNLKLLTELEIYVKFIKTKYSELLQDDLYAFEVKILIPEKKILESRILRLFINFETLVTNMEEQLIKRIPRVSDAVELSHENRTTILEKYFKFLVSTKQYRCPHLIQFLGYDPSSFEPLDFNLFAVDDIFFDLDN